MRVYTVKLKAGSYALSSRTWYFVAPNLEIALKKAKAKVRRFKMKHTHRIESVCEIAKL